MAENNSKKPMALLLLVVVGVLVVLYFAGGEAPCNKVTEGSCSEAGKTEDECVDPLVWTTGTTTALEFDNKTDCEANDGTWSGEEAPAEPPATDPTAPVTP